MRLCCCCYSLKSGKELKSNNSSTASVSIVIVEANLIDEQPLASVNPEVGISEASAAASISGSACTLSKFDPSQSIASTSIAEVEETFEVDSQNSLSSGGASAASITSSSLSTSTAGSTQTIIHVASDYCPALSGKVTRVGSDTFSNPLIQKVLQNYQSSPIIDVLECFAWLKIKHDFSK